MGGIGPFQNAPFVDDWVYAWSVEHWLETRRFETLDVSLNPNLLQIAWGSLFSLPFGFSFVALRLSTFVLALAGLAGFYLLLRELDVSRRHAAVGTAALGLHPIFAMLSVTFMTDVPFVSLTILACAAFVRALRRRRAAWLCAAAVLAALSVGIRLPGVVISVAMLVTLLVMPDGWGRQRGRWTAAGIPLAAFAGLVSWSQSHTHHVADVTWLINAAPFRLMMLRDYALPFLPAMLGSTLVLIFGTAGLALVPLSAACVRRDLIRGVLAASVCLIGAVAAVRALGGDGWLPLVTGNMWAANEIGHTAPLVPGFTGPVVPTVVGWLGLAIAALSLAAAGAACGLRWVWPSSALRLSIANPPLVFLVLLACGHALVTAVLWLIWDRYALIFVPLSIAVVLSAKPALFARTAAVALVWCGLFTVVGIRDHLAYNATLWRAVDALRSANVPDSEIHGGWMVNGWLQYAHPDRAHRDANGEVDVPWVNGSYDPPYAISNTPPDGWEVLQTFAYNRWIGSDGHLYVIEKVRK
jgi:hypothetical protein